MVQNRILLSPIPLEELEGRLEKIIQDQIEKKAKAEVLDRFLSVDETRKLFAPPVSKVTLHNWTKQGKIKDHKIGGRVFYKYSEVLDSLSHLKKYGR